MLLEKVPTNPQRVMLISYPLILHDSSFKLIMSVSTKYKAQKAYIDLLS